MMLLAIIFWISVIALLHSYVFYPAIASWMSSRKKVNDRVFRTGDSLPRVSVLLSVYNEEAVMEEKMQSMLASDYPEDKLDFWIGSDGSTDKTDTIIERFAIENSNIRLFGFGGRNGKANILNKLHSKMQEAGAIDEGHIFILTDANVMFRRETIFELTKNFKNTDIGQVGAQIVNQGMRKDGISVQEKFYISRENRIKYHEGRAWGTMMGAFGACYAMRADLFTVIPSNYLMEDFYESMHVLASGKKAMLEEAAICYEDIPNELSQEYKRKRRISAGNYQNLSSYYGLIWPPYTALAFSFLSHKVLRWFGPFFIAAALLCSAGLALQGNELYRTLFYLQAALLLIPLLDRALKKMGIHISLFRFISYFYHMNFALFSGFMMYIKGVRTNAWQPTKRNR